MYLPILTFVLLLSNSCIKDLFSQPKFIRIITYFTALPLLAFMGMLCTITLILQLTLNTTIVISNWIEPVGIIYIATQFSIFIVSKLYQLYAQMQKKQQFN